MTHVYRTAHFKDSDVSLSLETHTPIYIKISNDVYFVDWAKQTTAVDSFERQVSIVLVLLDRM